MEHPLKLGTGSAIQRTEANNWKAGISSSSDNPPALHMEKVHLPARLFLPTLFPNVKEDAMFWRTYYQYYTNVTYRTCPNCLSLHGKILRDPERIPLCEHGCEQQFLPFRRKERSYHREQRRKMRTISRAELVRRELFAEGLGLLGSENGRAVDLLSQSAQIDLFIPEVRRLIAEKGSLLKDAAAVRTQLREVFIRAYFNKFGRPPYERLPEPMRIAREEAGIAEIKELFA